MEARRKKCEAKLKKKKRNGKHKKMGLFVWE